MGVVMLRAEGGRQGAARAEAGARRCELIHLATARELGDELRALVTYDGRLAAAAKQLGYRIVQPR